MTNALKAATRRTMRTHRERTRHPRHDHGRLVQANELQGQRVQAHELQEHRDQEVEEVDEAHAGEAREAAPRLTPGRDSCALRFQSIRKRSTAPFLAMLLACWGFSLAVSGTMIPPRISSAESSRFTITRSCKGRKSMYRL